MATTEDKYQSALDYLYSFVDHSLTRNLRYSPEMFNLDRMYALMQLLGNPHQKYRVIHVAGTKGKGSICALIANVFKVANYRVGFYSSPHLQEYTERIRINNIEITKNEFADLVDEVRPFVSQVYGLTTFEIATAIAFLFFAQQKVDIAVIEVGLGGRLDATNIVQPIVSVISTISKDHVQILGNTLEKIATEKAGIIKPNVPVIISYQKPRITQLFKKIAQQRNSNLTDVQCEFRYIIKSQNLKGQDFVIFDKEHKNGLNLCLQLLGEHQIQNATAALAAIQAVKKNGFTISDKDIIEGFFTVEWPGRFEILSKKPLLIVDSAHNTESTRKLVNTIQTYLPGKKITLIFGASEDKDVKGMFHILLPRVNKLITTQANHPRALEAKKLLEIANTFGKNGEAILPIECALEKAMQDWTENSVIIAAGSIFIAAAIRDVWKCYQK